MKMTVATLLADIRRSLADDFRLEPVHVDGSPIFLAVAWPTAEGLTGCRPRLPAGRGTTLAQAMISSGAEAIEMRASLAQNRLEAIAGFDRHQGVAMITASDALDGSSVSVAAQEVFLDFAEVAGEVPFADANSTGCAAAASWQAAVWSGLMECIERDAMALWWHGGQPCAAASLALIDRQQPRLFWWLEQRNRQTQLLDLTCDSGVPVIAAVSTDQNGGRVAIGTAARPTIDEAALSAVTEMIQTEVAMAQAIAYGDEECLAWCDYGSTLIQPQFRPTLPPACPVRSVLEIDAVVRHLSKLGHRVLTVDLTLPDDPLLTVRVMVSGFCAMRGQFDTPRFARLTGRKVAKGERPRRHDPEPY